MTARTLKTQTTRLWRRLLPLGGLLTAQDISAVNNRGSHELRFETTMGKILATRVVVASSFAERFHGLLKRRSLDVDEGLLLSPGGSIHTLGMRFAIDVLFLDRHMRVLKAVPGLAPWRGALAPAGTEFTLELAPGRIVTANIGIGMRLLWSHAEADVDQ